jgi:hypothetical protein
MVGGRLAVVEVVGAVIEVGVCGGRWRWISQGMEWGVP